MADQKFREIKRRYYWTPLWEFASECARIGLEIATIKPRSYRERNELAEEAADALMEVGRRLDGGGNIPGTPEMAAARDRPVSESFGHWYEGLKRSERQRVVWRAATWVLRDKADGWLRPSTMGDRESPFRLGLAMDSDEGLAQVLRELDAFPRRER
jgi:hypothetical protein